MRVLFSVYGFAIFILLMIILLPLFIYSFFSGRIKGGNFLYKICRFWAGTFFILTGIKHRNSYHVFPSTAEEYIFVSNHISYLDIPMMIIATKDRNIRILGKSEMAKVPVFGFIYKQGAVLVDRESAEQRSNSVKDLLWFLKKNISVFICPEGTFNTTHAPLKKFYDGAFRIAIETGTSICPILFLDTYDRLNYRSIFSLNPGKSRAVFLEQTSTKNLTMNDIGTLREKVFKQMDQELLKYDATWIKKNPSS